MGCGASKPAMAVVPGPAPSPSPPASSAPHVTNPPAEKKDLGGGGAAAGGGGVSGGSTASAASTLIDNNMAVKPGDAARRGSEDTMPSARRSSHDAMMRTAGNKGIRWKKGQCLGRGVFGKVFLGLNVETGALMATKELSFGPQDKDAMDKLVTEITLMQKLDHPNIVRYLGSTIKDDPKTPDACKCLIFLEYVPGGSLESMLAKFGRFNTSLVQMYTRQLLTGLAYLHSQDILHRDVKTANVLMDDRGTIKLADFGESVHERPGELRESEKTGIHGTPYYMAPEVLSKERCVAKSDVWSAGCTVLHLFTGKHPWSEKGWTAAAPAMLHICTSDESPALPKHGLRPELKSFFDQCLARDVSKRGTAEEMLGHQFLAVEYGSDDDSECEDEEEAGAVSLGIRASTDAAFGKTFGDGCIDNGGQSNAVGSNKLMTTADAMRSDGTNILEASSGGDAVAVDYSQNGLLSIKQASTGSADGAGGGDPLDAFMGDIGKRDSIKGDDMSNGGGGAGGNAGIVEAPITRVIPIDEPEMPSWVHQEADPEFDAPVQPAPEGDPFVGMLFTPFAANALTYESIHSGRLGSGGSVVASLDKKKPTLAPVNVTMGRTSTLSMLSPSANGLPTPAFRMSAVRTAVSSKIVAAWATQLATEQAEAAFEEVPDIEQFINPEHRERLNKLRAAEVVGAWGNIEKELREKYKAAGRMWKKRAGVTAASVS